MRPTNFDNQNASKLSRRKFLGTGITAGTASIALPTFARGAAAVTPRSDEVPSFELDEITIADLQDGMKSGKFTARSIAQKYLDRIAQIDKQGPALNSIIELNPDALSIADQLDEERKSKGPRGHRESTP